MGQRYTVKSGRFVYDVETKKVKVSKQKGQLSLFTNEQGENHLSWVNIQLNIEELDIIVFPFDAIFQKVQTQNNTYLLRFQSNEDKYFFYLQQKINPQEFVQNVNKRIAYVPQQQSEKMQVQEPKEVKPQKMDVQHKQQPKRQVPNEEKAKKLEGLFNNDFIQKLQANLMAAKGNQGHGITHLSKILTPEAISTLLNELTPQEKLSLLQFLPTEQQDVSHIPHNIRSPQFQQAADVLSDALNSQHSIPLFMDLRLDQKYLKNHYGVHAFLKALQDWAQRQNKKQ